MSFADGTTSRTARAYPVEEHATYHAALDAAYPGDGALIVRASAWGGAAQADVIWPGDLDAQFEHQGDTLPGGGIAVGGLPAVVVDAQTLAVSGFPAFGSDTTGYRHDPTRESTLRWMEHTALTVVMQVYEDGARLPWLYDDAAGAEYQAMASLHQQLEPYNAILMRQAQTTGSPSIRPLPLAYPQDPGTFAVADAEYLLGPDLLVAPVTAAGVTQESVHLPPGRWVHWWSDVVTDGPADVTVQAPLGSPPLFARAGGLVPMLPEGIDTLVAGHRAGHRDARVDGGRDAGARLAHGVLGPRDPGRRGDGHDDGRRDRHLRHVEPGHDVAESDDRRRRPGAHGHERAGERRDDGDGRGARACRRSSRRPRVGGPGMGDRRRVGPRVAAVRRAGERDRAVSRLVVGH